MFKIRVLDIVVILEFLKNSILMIFSNFSKLCDQTETVYPSILVWTFLEARASLKASLSLTQSVTQSLSQSHFSRLQSPKSTGDACHAGYVGQACHAGHVGYSGHASNVSHVVHEGHASHA